MSDVRADLEALITEASDLLDVSDDDLGHYSDDLADALEGVCAVADHIHTARKGVA